MAVCCYFSEENKKKGQIEFVCCSHADERCRWPLTDPFTEEKAHPPPPLLPSSCCLFGLNDSEPLSGISPFPKEKDELLVLPDFFPPATRMGPSLIMRPAVPGCQTLAAGWACVSLHFAFFEPPTADDGDLLVNGFARVIAPLSYCGCCLALDRKLLA